MCSQEPGFTTRRYTILAMASKLQVYAGNTHARVVYQALGYQEVAVTLVKPITNELP
jgi:hypothetical protein